MLQPGFGSGPLRAFKQLLTAFAFGQPGARPVSSQLELTVPTPQQSCNLLETDQAWGSYDIPIDLPAVHVGNGPISLEMKPDSSD